MLQEVMADYTRLVEENRNLIKECKSLIEWGNKDKTLFDMIDDCNIRIKDMQHNRKLAGFIMSKEKCVIR